MHIYKNKLIIFPLLISIILSAFVSSHEDAEESVQASTISELLQLVKEGKTKEQSINNQREKEFLANKNKQASILAAEKRELARQEKIADTLEAEYKKNEEILRVKEEAY